MFRYIFRNEGVAGLTKGIQASFYGAIIYGFTYFYLYKLFKETYKKHIGESSAFMFLLASCFTQMIALWVFYPFDMIKVRLQTSNHIFKYKGLKNAFIRIFYQHNSLKGFYVGFPVYLCTYVTNFSFQITIYELITGELKERGDYANNEYGCVLGSSAVSGLIAASLTNPLEVLAVRKQTDPSIDLKKIIREEKFKLIGKGLAARA
jgi:hypothetical protein